MPKQSQLENKNSGPKQLRVRDLMSKKLYTLKPDDNLYMLQELLSSKPIRHVPIVDDDGALVGLVTQRDFLTIAVSKLAKLDQQELKEVYQSLRIREVMGRKIWAVGPNFPLDEAAMIMFKNKYGCLPVVEDEKLVGIITEADFLVAFVGLETGIRPVA